MRNLFSLIGFVVVAFLGFGWYLGWYKLDWATKSDGTTSVHVDVDTKKVAGDLRAGANRAEEFIATLKTKTPAEKAKQQTDDPNFVGPPIPADWQAPGAPKATPAAGLPGPGGQSAHR